MEPDPAVLLKQVQSTVDAHMTKDEARRSDEGTGAATAGSGTTPVRGLRLAIAMR